MGPPPEPSASPRVRSVLSPTGPVALAVVGVGGAVGALLRWALASALPTSPGGLGWSTAIVNLTGSFLLGVLVAALAEAARRAGRAPVWHHLARLGLGTGLLGGWTTFSTLAVEVEQALDAGRAGVGVAALALSLVGGVALAGVGMATGHRLGATR